MLKSDHYQVEYECRSFTTIKLKIGLEMILTCLVLTKLSLHAVLALF